MQLKSRQIYRRQAYKTGSALSIGPTTTRYLLLIVLAAFSLLYLIQSAQGADKTVDLRDNDKHRTEINKELTSLQVNASRLQSLQTLQDSADKQGLVPITGSVESLNVNQ